LRVQPKQRKAGVRPGETRRGGRPTLAEARRREERLLETAGAMFMRHGFDGTSIDGVAEAAGVSKRTLYARYRDKNALFRAVLRQLIERWLVPIQDFRTGTSDLEPMLREIARHLLASALQPMPVAIYRIIIAESQRRPEFGQLAQAGGRQAAVRAVAAALDRFRSEIRPHDLELAAEQFISVVVDSPLRLAALGLRDPREMETRIGAAVDLFLNGVRKAG
jgi:TetR/AcrR family transcriptional regulator, mexJK operon transcriptional repressor